MLSAVNLTALSSKLKNLKPCLCSRLYPKEIQQGWKYSVFWSARVYSTQSDRHRQKAVIDTSTPKIVINKNLIDDKEKDGKVNEEESLYSRIEPYVKLARWDKPIGVYLLYWPCTWSIALGSIPGTAPPAATLHTAALFLLGAGLMRGAGCTINDMFDKDIDAQVERTRSRPLVSGQVSSRAALGFLAAQLAGALLVLTQLNCYSVALGASSMVLVVTYPLAKRFTNYPQLFLGATFNWGALLGYSAMQGSVDWRVCAPLYVGALAWTVIYDTIYAHQDKMDDARIGVKSTALTFGAHTRPALAAALCASVGAFAVAGAQLGPAYHAALVVYAAHVGRQIYTLDTENPQDCSAKFKSNAWVGLVILLGILGGGRAAYRANRQRAPGDRPAGDRPADRPATASCFFS